MRACRTSSSLPGGWSSTRPMAGSFSLSDFTIPGCKGDDEDGPVSSTTVAILRDTGSGCLLRHRQRGTAFRKWSAHQVTKEGGVQQRRRSGEGLCNCPQEARPPRTHCNGERDAPERFLRRLGRSDPHLVPNETRGPLRLLLGRPHRPRLAAPPLRRCCRRCDGVHARLCESCDPAPD